MRKIFLEKMQLFYAILLSYIHLIAFWFRYKITIKGLDLISQAKFPKKNGILFLANHVSLFDAQIICSYLCISLKQLVGLVVTSEVYENHPVFFVRHHLRMLKSLPFPNFFVGFSDVLQSDLEKSMKELINGLKQEQNYLYFPSGKLKLHGHENLGANSGVHSILQQIPDVNIVLVRLEGLWGSRLSYGWNGDKPNEKKLLKELPWIILKNLFFFIPRRHVTIQFEIAPSNFPRQGTKKEINQYLESYFPDEQKQYAPYYFWRKEDHFPAPTKKSITNNPISMDILKKVAEISQMPITNIHKDSLLGKDLQLGASKMSRLIDYLEKSYDHSLISWSELEKMDDLFGLAANRMQILRPSHLPQIIDEEKASCLMSKNRCADRHTAPLSHIEMEQKILSLADQLESCKDQRIGIILDQSVEALIVVLALLRIGKTPIIIDWNAGAAELDHLIEKKLFQHVLTSKKTWWMINNIQVGRMKEHFIYLENLKGKEKAKTSKTPSEKILFIQKGKEIEINLKELLPLPLEKDAIILNTLPTWNPQGFCQGSLLPFLNGNPLILFSTYRTSSSEIMEGILKWNPNVVFCEEKLYPPLKKVLNPECRVLSV